MNSIPPMQSKIINTLTVHVYRFYFLQELQESQHK